MAATAVTREEQLSWESRWATPVAASAFGFVALTVAASFIANAVFTAPPGPAGPETLLAIANQPSGWLWASVVQTVPVLLLIPVLLYMERAAAFRVEVMKTARMLAVLGPLMLAVLGVANSFAVADLARDFAATPEAKVLATELPSEKATAPATKQGLEQAITESTARYSQIDEAGNVYQKMILAGGTRSILAGVAQAGALAIGFALILISQAGIKAGLTSRFLGYIGIGVGAFYGLGALFTALGLGAAFSPMVLQVFWLGALAMVFIDRWPNGRGPAWDTGTAKPWPTAQEQRAAAERRADARGSQLQPGPEQSSSDENGTGSTPPPNPRKKKKRR
jgi:hypothetical protein